MVEGRKKEGRDRVDLVHLDHRDRREEVHGAEVHEEVLRGRFPKQEEWDRACQDGAASCGEEDPSCVVAFLHDLKVEL